ncbi:unnamed protein product [Owenia fusiformis]|uniref:G-protein coupled receptors family 1 profile domain-containing protein n=1 Tax=Owenia fusiformis TaxID=6347 RepID=A0A8S4Q4I3_OWEFU|nr:unnamed protein product [Owenia fusiformis]
MFFTNTSMAFSSMSYKSTVASDTISDDVTQRGIYNVSATINAVNATFEPGTEITETMYDYMYEDYEEYIEFKIADILNTYVLFGIIIVGLVGNVTSIVVLRCSSMFLNPPSVYLIALAISDSFALILGGGRVWVISLWDIDIRELHEWVCKIHHVAIYTLLDFSAWLLVALSVDRVITVYMPLRAKLVCTRIRAVIVSLCILITLILINGHYLFTVGYFAVIIDNEVVYESNCYIVEGLETFHTEYWFWIDAVFASFLPFTLLMISNITIVVVIIRASQRRRQTMQAVSSSSSSDNQTRSLTIMLICLSITFLILTGPVVVFFLLDRLNVDPKEEASYDRVKSHMYSVIVFCLMYTNNAINFILYCVSGKKFRSSLVDVFCGSRRRRNMLKDSRTSLSTSRSVLSASDVSQTM